MNDTMIRELERKEKEYIKYIEEHIANVKIAHQKYGNKLCKILNIAPIILSYKINEHDKSKYSEEEFNGYRQWFYPCSFEHRNEELFNKAWEHHYMYNQHHPEYWNIDMPPIAIAEMILDWEAMSMKFGGNTYDYYIKNRDTKSFTEKDKKILDIVLKALFYNKK